MVSIHNTDISMTLRVITTIQQCENVCKQTDGQTGVLQYHCVSLYGRTNERNVLLQYASVIKFVVRRYIVLKISIEYIVLTFII